MAADFLHDPYEVHVGSMDLRANTSITQIVEVMDDYSKYPRLLHYLRKFNDGSRMLVFVETKKGCDQLTRSLRGEGLPVVAIHGDKSQIERDDAIRDFKSGRFTILAATDVAARGLDIKDVSNTFSRDPRLKLLAIQAR